MATISCRKVIENFISGTKQEEEGSLSSTKTVYIRGNQLIHYNTPIIERTDKEFILNVTRYSIATGQLQKYMKTILPEGYHTVRGVQQDYVGSLSDFLK